MPSLRDLAQRWAIAQAAERANAQSYLIELCHALGVEPPRPAGSGYEFEFPIKVISRKGEESTNFIDLYKASFFALEAKDQEEGRSEDLLLRKAFGQLRGYLGHLPDERPPYLMVLDVGRTLMIWDRWNGDYGGFNQGRRIDLRTLADRPPDVELLRAIWTNPASLDPRSRAVAVTKDLAGQLAKIATELEAQGYAHERVARFLIRCVFTMFAEDVGLLPGEPFRRLIDEAALEDPKEFVPLAEDLWRAMDRGERFLLKKLLRFNGHFFKEPEALPLDRKALAFLLEAARADWSGVEPTIFGTLLTRALDPQRRHRLGAEYTPREFVERVVRPTVEQPIRERWTAVQAEVLELREQRKTRSDNEAEKRLREFHTWLRGLRFLDPACGSGNFLYVTMHLVKRIELEVIRALEEITGSHEIRLEEVGPWQFYGIEVDAWPREIAELTLWIGFHQFWKAHHDVQPPEPILQDTGTLDLRDAVLAWDRIQHDPHRARPDPTPRIKDPVSGRLVPDPSMTLPYEEHVDARPTEWPEADFILGNPPYMGSRRMRVAFGEGYVDALHAAYPSLPDGVDYVMYWWWKAALAVASGRTIRAGLITTNSIVQSASRRAVEAAFERGARVMWAVADHPWTEDAEGAAVRVAMTVIAKEPAAATRVEVDEAGHLQSSVTVDRLNADLTAIIDVPSAAKQKLLANEGLAYMGVKLVGNGFILEAEEARALLAADPRHAEIVRRFYAGRDLTRQPRDRYVIDFGFRTEDEAKSYPVLYDIVRSRVKPERDANKKRYKEVWWQFGVPNAERREAAEDLTRYIATVETSRRRFFVFLPVDVVPDGTLIAIASDDSFLLGVLSSMVHVTWAMAAGGRLGVGNDARYSNGVTFSPFPFPAPGDELRMRVAAVAERLDWHRKEALARSSDVTITGMYAILEKLQSGEALTAAEHKVYDMAACGVLRDLHDEMDAVVAEAYGWEWPLREEEVLSRLVALHDQRVQEERAGLVRWLRPAYQGLYVGQGVVQVLESLEAEEAVESIEKTAWPAGTVEQIQALQNLVMQTSRTVEEAASEFRGARRETVERHLETLALMGEVQRMPDGQYQWVAAAA